MTYNDNTQPDEILTQLAKLVEGWDPPEDSKSDKAATASAVTFSPQTELVDQRKAMCAQLSSIIGRATKKKKGNQ